MFGLGANITRTQLFWLLPAPWRTSQHSAGQKFEARGPGTGPEARRTKLADWLTTSVSSGQMLSEFRSVLQAAQRDMPTALIRAVHERTLGRGQPLIDRGQRVGVFRNDLPKKWLATTPSSLIHAAAEDSAAGRLDAD